MSGAADQAIVAELVDDVFTKHARGQSGSDVPDDAADGIHAGRDSLWKELEELGLTLASVPEDLGGAGGTIAHDLTIMRVAGAHGTALPLLETSLAGWLLAAAGLPSEPGPTAVAPAGFGDRIDAGSDGAGATTLSGVSTGTAFVPEACRLVVCGREPAGEAFVTVLAVDADALETTVNTAGEARYVVRFEAMPAVTARVDDRAVPEQLLRRGAVGRCAMMVGAMQTIRDLTVAYADDRKQFGRSIRKFQVIEHQLAVMARECALAAAMTDAAACLLATETEAPFAEVAAAKVVCGNAATAVASIAHQVHGAIGITREYPLSTLTRRLLAWRDDFGGERAWSTALGRELLGVDLWTRLSATGRLVRDG